MIGVASSLLLVTACSTGSGSGGDDSPPPPQPVSAKEYATMLTGALGPLDTALDGLATANAYKGLDDRVSAVETATRQAADKLTPVQPPAELSSQHTQLVAALQAFEKEVGGVGEQINDRVTCTGGAVRADLGDAKATAGLRAAIGAAVAQLPGTKIAVSLPAADQQGDARPSNGKLLRSRGLDGEGLLTIDNGGSSDAVVTITKGRKPTAAVYVRKGKQYTVKEIPDGTYAVFFTGGTDWDGKARAFGHKCAFQKFDQSLGFRTTRTTTQTFYQTYRITLQPVAGGTAKTDQVDPDRYPNE
jgi:hypothetical protein